MTSWSRRAAAIGLLVSLGAVLVLTLAPVGADLDELTIRLHDVVQHHVPLAPDRLTPEDYGRLLNVVLFVPLGLCLAWWLGRHWGWAAPALVALSLFVELAQHVLKEGRDANLDDVGCNAVGATIGVVVVALVRAVVTRQDP